MGKKDIKKKKDPLCEAAQMNAGDDKNATSIMDCWFFAMHLEGATII